MAARSIAAAAVAGTRRGVSDAVRHRVIQAVPREATGRRKATRERAQGRIPAVVLSLPFDAPVAADPSSAKQLLTADAEQIRELLMHGPFFCSTPINLQVRAGVQSDVVLHSGTVLPVKVHRHKETGEVLNLVMAWAEKGMHLRVDVPIVYKGEDACPGLIKGGYLRKMRSSLKYLCPAETIPQSIEVDLVKLDVGDSFGLRDIKAHPSLTLLSKNENMAICKILPTNPDKVNCNEPLLPSSS